MKQKAFTLIELLLVIAMLGLLSSIVLFSAREAIERAKIAAALRFSQSLYHALFVDLVGYWGFDDGADPTGDSSSYGNDGDLINMDPATDYVDGIIRNALQLDGDNDYVDCGNDSSLNNLSQFTYEAWIHRIGSNITQTILSKSVRILFQVNSDNKLKTYIEGCKFFNGMFCSSAQSISIETIPQNTWVHVVMTYDDIEDRTVYLFLNGNKVTYSRQWTLPADMDMWDNSGYAQWIGRMPILDRYFDGLIDEVRVYKKVLTAGEIQKHYAEGLKRHQLVINP